MINSYFGLRKVPSWRPAPATFRTPCDWTRRWNPWTFRRGCSPPGSRSGD